MQKFLTLLTISLFATLVITLASCQDQPESNETQNQIIEKGQIIHASMGSLVFYIVNDFPDIYPVPGMSDYSEAPTISFVGVVDSLDEIALNNASQWRDRCEIVNNGGYIAKVKRYDPTIQTDRIGYIFMFVEIIQKLNSDTPSIKTPRDIRVTYRLMQ